MVLQGQDVVVTYTDPTAGTDDANAIQDTNGNDTPTFTTGQGGVPAVINNSEVTADTTAPTLDSAELATTGGFAGRQVLLTYSEDLDTASVPDTSAFTVMVGGESRTATLVAIPLSALVGVRFTPIARPGETVTVSYTPPATNPLQDAAENEVAAFTTGESGVPAVANNLAATAPDAPEYLVATTGDAKVTLTWETAWFNGSAITKYQYQQKAGTGSYGSWTDIADSAPGEDNANSFEVTTNITNGTSYTFRVRAVNGVGNGDPSNQDEATPETCDVLWCATLIVGAHPQPEFSGYGFGISYTGSSLTPGTFEYLGTEYTVNSSTITPSGALNIAVAPPVAAADVAQWVFIVDGQEFPAAATSTLTVGTSFTSFVWFEGGMTWRDGQGVAFKLVETATEETTETPEPTTNTAASGAPSVSGTTQVGATLTAVTTGITDANGLTGATYKYQWIRVDGGTDSNIHGATSRTYKLRSPDAGKSIKVSVSFTDNEGFNEGPLISAAVGPVTTTKPEPPRGLAAGRGDRSVKLAWLRPVDDGGSAILHYQYHVKAESGSYGDWTDIPDSGVGEDSANKYTVSTGLSNGTPYTFQVRAVNVVDPSDPSNEASATPAEVSPPTRPRTVSAGVGNRQITLQWGTPEDDGNSPITGYEFRQRFPDGSDDWETIPGGGETRSHTVTDLNNGVFHGFYLRARNAEGPSPQVNAAGTPRVGAPGAPPNFTAEAYSGRQIRLSWTQPTAGSNVTITGYYLIRSEDGVTSPNGGSELAPGLNEMITGTSSKPVTRCYRIRTFFELSNGEKAISAYAPEECASTTGEAGDVPLIVAVSPAWGTEGEDDTLDFQVYMTRAAES